MQKKHKETKKDVDFIRDNNRELEQFRFLLGELSEEYLNKYDEIIGKKLKDHIPANIFNSKLSPLETVAKYLKEKQNLSLKQIGELLKRSEKTIWQAYNNSKKKQPGSLKYELSKYHIPVSILKLRKFSILESIVYYLKENYNLNYHDTGVLLERDERTIWTVYNRVKNKRK